MKKTLVILAIAFLFLGCVQPQPPAPAATPSPTAQATLEATPGAATPAAPEPVNLSLKGLINGSHVGGLDAFTLTAVVEGGADSVKFFVEGFEKHEASLQGNQAKWIVLPGTTEYGNRVFEAKAFLAGAEVGAVQVTALVKAENAKYGAKMVLPIGLSIAPGNEVKYNASLKNTGTGQDVYDVSLESSSGWKTNLSNAVIELAPREEFVFNASVFVPQGAEPETQDFLSVAVQSRNSEEVLLEYDVTTTVASVFKWTIDARFVELSGSVFHYDVFFSNQGNQADEIVFVDESVPEGFTAAVNHEQRLVQPGETQHSTIEIDSAGVPPGNYSFSFAFLPKKTPGFKLPANIDIELTG